jgi:hypothetical protein
MRNMQRIIRIWVGVLLAITACCAADDSLEGYFFPDKVGAWEYRRMTYDLFQYRGNDLGFERGHDKPFSDKVQGIFDIVRANPVFNPPLGFQARATTTWASIIGLPANTPLNANFQVTFYYFINEAGKASWGGEANTSFNMHFNPKNPLYKYVFLTTPDNFVIYKEPHETSRAGDVPIYDEDMIVLSGRKPWIPATCEQYLTAWLKTRAAVIAETESRIAAYDASAPYKAWLAEKPKRLKSIEDVYQSLKRSNPQKAEEMRAQMQKMEVEMEAGLKKNQVPASEGNNAGLDMLRRTEANVRHLLESMTSGQKATAAWYKRDESGLEAGLVAPGTTDARALIVLNPQMYDRTLPQAEIQLIMVEFEDFRGLSEAHVGRRRLLQFRDTADWARIAKIIGIR